MTWKRRICVRPKVFGSAAFIILVSFLLSVNWVLHVYTEKSFNMNVIHQMDANDKIPVFIVDEHHEVIPHWFDSLNRGFIDPKKNLLIHIDGHSDMALPEKLGNLKKLKSWRRELDLIYSSKLRINEKPILERFFHLMQSNDVFIMSAISNSLINDVIWIKPSWLEEHDETEFEDAFIGWTVDNTTQKEVFCSCHKNVKSKTSDISCEYLPDNSEDGEEKPIQVKLCRKIREFRYISVSETVATKLITLKKHSIIVDIDEDFFGVESGVQAFMQKGIQLQTIDKLDELLPVLFFPTSNEHEAMINEKLKNMFYQLSNIENNDLSRINFIHKTLDLCITETVRQGNSIELFIKFINLLENKELKALSNIEYCATGTFMMISQVQPSFTVCHGNNFPDTSNQIYVPTVDEIRTRGENLTDILTFICKHSIPRIFTISRSLRDGYTPRFLQQYIEKTVFQSIETALGYVRKTPNYIYDKYLLKGEEGWEN